MATPIGELPEPDLAQSRVWWMARRLVQVALQTKVTVPFISTQVLGEPLNQTFNLYKEDLLLAFSEDPEAARRDLVTMTRTLRAMHRWYREAVPREQLQPIGVCNRCQPRGHGQMCGCATHLVSDRIYREYVADLDFADGLLSDCPGGGMLHLCGSHTQHIPVWRETPELRAVQLNDPATEDLEKYFRGLREDQIIYMNPTEAMTVERAMEITGGHRLVLVADIKEPPRCRKRVGKKSDIERDNCMPSNLTVFADQGVHTISRNIYGHFAEHLGRCIYEGIWVGGNSPIPNTRGIRNDVVEALRRIRIPVLRWPGGCFADEYHWKDGIGLREMRPTMVNTHWGGVTENNHFGTHEFMDLCDQLGCEPYICGNVGSGTVREMQEWVEYLTFDGISPMADMRRRNGRAEPWRLKYWGVGNENWGCGGNMRPEYYLDEYRRFQTYVRNFAGNEIFKIACGPVAKDYNWTEVLMRGLKNMWGLDLLAQGLSFHYYCGSGKNSRSATEFGKEDWFQQLSAALLMEELLARHSAIMDQYDPGKATASIVDEWGAWHEAEPGTNPRFLFQQNTLRDALVAGVTLNIFNDHCDRVRMANIAQTVNVLQAMILTDGPKMLLTPTYHVFDMYQVHHDALMLPVKLECDDYEHEGEQIPSISVSASRSRSGNDSVGTGAPDTGDTLHLSICHLDPTRSRELRCDLRGFAASHVTGRILSANVMTEHNTFDKPDRLSPITFDDARIGEDGLLHATLPPMSVAVLEIR